ncbi:diacylglycerol kinase family protein [Actinacidiphila paucisporea]|uniref:Diacylglycerol kinase family enzyme n=1 Tax=Actinacidiphila paucisporea TaxID=310782 RepID=A0A1M7MP32_9ACTN|nr:diacylglycerol kinase family protein [Actinacidiphila paucisporea]SHM92693.1 Diacylglycerol kinase family enzyme [Actinacidiphila paucisporea]
MPTALPDEDIPGPGLRPSRPRPSPPRAVRAPVLTTGATTAAARITALTVCQAALLIGFGLLITGPARHLWPIASEDRVNEGFEHLRTGTFNTLTSWGSEAGNTLTIVAITLAVCAALVLAPVLPRWREAVFLAVSVSLQALAFLAITTAVDRHRPEVHRLDSSPPTSSYTSGHTGAATALYGGLAVLVLTRARRLSRPWRIAVAALLMLLPLAVGACRLYRGMHHVTDVTGGMLNGTLSLLIVGRSVLAGDAVPAPLPEHAVDAAVKEARGTAGPVPGTTVVVVNPVSVSASDRDRLRLVLERHGRVAPHFVETTPDDPGHGQAARAAADGAALVVVCGGDGTVRAVADALAGTGVPLAVAPHGTGNLLARNLGLPLDPARALDAALGGAPHPMDLGRIEGDGLPATHFCAMAGAGLDAELMARTPECAKSALGWPAYALALLRALRTPRMELTLRLDGAEPVRRTARMAVIANVGALQGGASLAPDARPDDGLLHVALLDPRGARGWASATSDVLRGPSSPSRPGGLEVFTCREAELVLPEPRPREIDGDPVAAGRRMSARVVPGAVRVLLPEPGPEA